MHPTYGLGPTHMVGLCGSLEWFRLNVLLMSGVTYKHLRLRN